jgi:hypothetical protein
MIELDYFGGTGLPQVQQIALTGSLDTKSKRWLVDMTATILLPQLDGYSLESYQRLPDGETRLETVITLLSVQNG